MEIYGDYWDNAGRFAFFCYAVLEASKQVFMPDVLHCNDWQAALIPVLKKSTYQYDWAWGRVPAVVTIHNMGYQGDFDKSAMTGLGLSWELFTMYRLEQHDRLNLLKGGIVYSDAVTTVSPKYASEIQTPEYGYGLDSTMRDHRGKLRGILNGVDYTEWNPASDPHIAAKYTPADLTGKLACKRDLLQEFGLAHESRADLERPLIGIVSRFAWQKGFDLIAGSAYEMMREDREFRGARLGRSAVRKFVPRVAVCFPRKGCGAHRILERAGAQDRGWQRHVPDAVAIRALRAEPDVQPEIRNAADRPRDGRTRRYRGRGDRIQVRDDGRHGDDVGHPRGAGGVSQQGSLAPPDARRDGARPLVESVGARVRASVPRPD